MRKNYNNYSGFTLAEVLVTLVIIGVIAAMTIPALMNNLKKQEFVSQLKNTYSDLSQATTSILGDNGGSLIGLCNDHDHDCLMDLYLAKISAVKICTTSDTISGVCWHGDNDSYRLSSVVMSWVSTRPAFISSRGSMIRFTSYSGTCGFILDIGSENLNSDIGCGIISVDVNGFVKPNIVGRDIFEFAILKDRILPLGSDYDNFACSGTGHGCAGKVLLEGKMEY